MRKRASEEEKRRVRDRKKEIETDPPRRAGEPKRKGERQRKNYGERESEGK